MSLQRETHHFYRGTVALLHPTFRLRQIRTVASYSINTHKISHTQSKKLLKKKKRLNRICYFRFKPEIQENSLWKHYFCRACRICALLAKQTDVGRQLKPGKQYVLLSALQYTLHQLLTLASCKQNASGAWIRVIQQMPDPKWHGLRPCLFI